MPSLDVLRAITTNAAEMLGWQDRVGSVAPGKSADLVAVEGDGLADVTAPRDLEDEREPVGRVPDRHREVRRLGEVRSRRDPQWRARAGDGDDDDHRRSIDEAPPPI